MIQEKIEVINFLKRNGFKRESKNHYITDVLSVDLESGIDMAFPNGDEISISLDYFAMLGLLVYVNKKFNLEMITII